MFIPDLLKTRERAPGAGSPLYLTAAPSSAGPPSSLVAESSNQSAGGGSGGGEGGEGPPEASLLPLPLRQSAVDSAGAAEVAVLGFADPLGAADLVAASPTFAGAGQSGPLAEGEGHAEAQVQSPRENAASNSAAESPPAPLPAPAAAASGRGRWRLEVIVPRADVQVR